MTRNNFNVFKYDNILSQRSQYLPTVGVSKTYEASDSDPGLRSTVDAQCPVKYKLELKEGTQVCEQFHYKQCAVGSCSYNS